VTRTEFLARLSGFAALLAAPFTALSAARVSEAPTYLARLDQAREQVAASWAAIDRLVRLQRRLSAALDGAYPGYGGDPSEWPLYRAHMAAIDHFDATVLDVGDDVADGWGVVTEIDFVARTVTVDFGPSDSPAVFLVFHKDGLVTRHRVESLDPPPCERCGGSGWIRTYARRPVAGLTLPSNLPDPSPPDYVAALCPACSRRSTLR
jgi:hypothetical protein